MTSAIIVAGLTKEFRRAINIIIGSKIFY
jgi:hypothetical protein